MTGSPATEQTPHRSRRTFGLKRVLHPLLAVLCVLAATACEDELPTAEDGDLLPVSARTVEIRLPFEEFGREARTYFGYGAPFQLGRGMVAEDFHGIRARTLIRYSPPPAGITVRDSTGATVGDSLLTFVGGRAVIRFDTLDAPTEPVTVAVAALTAPWDPRSATWEMGVDTVAGQSRWPEAGGGPVLPLDSATWDPAEGDSLVIQVDSAVVNTLADTADPSRGLRLATATAGARLGVVSAVLRLDTRPSVNPDTLVTTSVGLDALTFIYDPFPTAPAGGELRVGGTPAWRTVLRFEMPERIEEPHPACAQISCPFEIAPEEVILAALVLQTAPSPLGFRPDDSLSVETRPVLAPDRLPRSPLGARISSVTDRIPPGAFGEEGPRIVSLPVTGYVRDLLRGESSSGIPVSSTLALVAEPEPGSFGFATFSGAGGEAAPFLRIVLTLTDGVSLP